VSYLKLEERGHRYYADASSISEFIPSFLHNAFRPVMTYDRQASDFPSRRSGNAGNTEQLAGTIIRRILTSAPIRPTPKLTEPNRIIIENRITRAIHHEMPISAHMLWSPKKHWMRGPNSSVDLAELTALQTLLSVHCAVREVWGPALLFHLCVEDLEFEFMEGRTGELVEARQHYVSGLRRLIKALGLGKVFRISTTSEKARDEVQLNAWRTTMAANYRALKAYWHESEACEPALWQSLPSFHDLRRIGWKGMLPPEMRLHYLSRLNMPEDGAAQDRVDMVLRNLAGILLHYQTGLLRGTDASEPIRFSFVPPAKGVPEELLLGRLDLRFVPRQVCSLVGAAAPWSTKGYVVKRDNQVKLQFRGWRDVVKDKSRFTRGLWSLAGIHGTADVRADILHDSLH
jgi:hypothetical protein